MSVGSRVLIFADTATPQVLPSTSEGSTSAYSRSLHAKSTLFNLSCSGCAAVGLHPQPVDAREGMTWASLREILYIYLYVYLLLDHYIKCITVRCDQKCLKATGLYSELLGLISDSQHFSFKQR